MPRVAEFAGIIIWMYAHDHPGPHFHAKYSGDEAVYSIATLSRTEGDMPRSQDKKVREWANRKRSELESNWALIEAGEQPKWIGN